MKDLLVRSEWLEPNLKNPKLRIVDCRWVLGKPGEGRRLYEEGHIPGAVHLDVETDLSGRTGPGRHPLPTPQEFTATMNRIGIGSDAHVVAYDAGNGMPAPRLWWLLRYFGHDKVSVLDGGWKGWATSTRPVERGPSPRPSPACGRGWTAASRPSEGPIVDKKYILQKLHDPNTLLIDARAPERYRGEVEPIDKRAGHIPGAVNLPFMNCVDEEGRYKMGGREEFKGKSIICYCGSGITACTDIFTLQLAGIEAKLYEGSWSDWSQDSDLPIATGSKS